MFVVPERSIRSPKDKRPTTTNENTVSQTDRQTLTERVCLALGSLTHSVRPFVGEQSSLFLFLDKEIKAAESNKKKRKRDRRVEKEEEDKNKRTTGKNKQSQMGRNGEEVRGK